MRHVLSVLWRVVAWPFRALYRGYAAITTEQARKGRDIALSLCGIACVLFLLTNRQLHEDSAQRGREVRNAIDRIEDLATENERLAEKIEAQTSPEAQQQQRALIQQVVDLIGCENEDTIQRLIDVLEERGVLDEGLLNVITDECKMILGPDGEPRFDG
jgi:hypothetical protein